MLIAFLFIVSLLVVQVNGFLLSSLHHDPSVSRRLLFSDYSKYLIYIYIYIYMILIVLTSALMKNAGLINIGIEPSGVC
jgi:hypothetical protein